jgi:hypothetical protein
MVIRQKKIKVQKRTKGGREEDRGREVERPQREMEKKRFTAASRQRLNASLSLNLGGHSPSSPHNSSSIP